MDKITYLRYNCPYDFSIFIQRLQDFEKEKGSKDKQITELGKIINKCMK